MNTTEWSTDFERSDQGQSLRSNSTSSYPYEIIQDYRNESLANIEILVLSIILFLAIVGNGLMLIALRRQLMFRPLSRMYFFMLNLSIADLMVAFGNILPQLAWDITFRFKGTDLLCRLIKFLQIFVLYLSTYVLTSMAVDQYMVICHQTFSRNHYGGLKGPKLMVTISWILSFIFASPQAIIFTLSEIKKGTGVIDCWTFLEPWGIQIYVTWFVVSVFILPLLIVGLSYGAICIKVVSFSIPPMTSTNKSTMVGVSKNQATNNGYGRYSKRKQSFSSSSIKTESETVLDDAPLQKGIACRSLKRQISQAKTKTLKLTLVVVLCFFVCWAPFCITQLIMVYNPNIPVGPLNVILLLLASLNSCTNPWVYLAFSESLCNQLRILVGLGLRRGSDEESIGDDQDLPAPIPYEKHKSGKLKGDHMEHQMKLQPTKRLRSFVDQSNQDDLQIQPETKSEVI